MVPGNIQEKYLSRYKMKITRRQFIKKAALYGGIGILASYPVLVETHLLHINHYNIPVSNLPHSFHGFKIVHITDIHFGPLVSLNFVRNVIHKANAIPADMIVCTGDYVHEKHSKTHIDTVWPVLSQLKAQYGVYSVLGNHDHWADFEQSQYWLERTGQNLRHKSVKISKDGEDLWLAGAGDHFEDSLGIDKALKNVPPDNCKIVLAHNPDSADQMFRSTVDLFISGHTHGGQVNIPFVGPLILPVANKNYSSGYIQSEKFGVFISRGIGWAIIPVRFNCFPEIAVLNLTPMES